MVLLLAGTQALLLSQVRETGPPDSLPPLPRDTRTALKKELFIPVPAKASMMAAVFPGLGQMYNRKYWKVPLVYVGFGGLAYAIQYNESRYDTYFQAYKDFIDDIDATDSYLDLIRGFSPEEIDPEVNPSNAEYFKDQLKNNMEFFRRNRELSYIGVAAWYLITILDANVDAHLYNYDVGDDLSVKLEAVPVQTPYYPTMGLGLKVTF